MPKQLFNNDKPYATTNAFKKTHGLHVHIPDSVLGFDPISARSIPDSCRVHPMGVSTPRKNVLHGRQHSETAHHAPLKLSYAELVGPQDAMWFVSHWWGCLVLNLRVSRFLEEIPELPIIPSWMYFMFFWADVKLQSLSISGWVHSVPFCPRSFLNRNKFEHKSYCGFADKPSLGCGSEMLWGTEFRVYCEALSRHAKAWGILGFRWPGMRGRCGDSHDGRCMQL